MKLWGIFRFEFGYQARGIWPYLICAVLVGFAFLFVRVNFLEEALYADLLLNSPFLIASATVFGGLIWLLVGASIAGEAAARDVATGMYPLIYTVPLRKADLLGGRFLAALALNALILLAVQVGIMLAIYLPGVHPAAVGPFRVAAYATAYGFIALPNAIVATALQFSLALRTGRPMASYLGSVFLFFMGFFVASALLFKRGLGTLLDPIGIRFVVEDLAHLWTTVEQGTRLLGLEGPVLANRLLWLGTAFGVLVITHLRFRFAHRAESARLLGLGSLSLGRWRQRSRPRAGPASTPAPIRVTARLPTSASQVPRKFSVTFHGRQTLAVARDSITAIARSWAGLGLLVGIPLLTIPVVLDQMESGGVPLAPATVLVLQQLTAPLSAELSRWVIVPLFIAFFAGELVWRERDAGLGEITDAMPGSDWAPLLGKLLGLVAGLAVFMALLALAGVLAQLIRGYSDFQPGLYLKILFGLQLPEYILFGVLALGAHVLANHKYIGHLVASIVYVFIALAPMFGIEHDLLIYGAGPGWSYTEMRGFGASVAPWLWFKLYWASWALLLAVGARLLWVRGRPQGLRLRLRAARDRLTRTTAWTATAAVGLMLSLGGFIFYNTNILNRYFSVSEIAERRAKYERTYGQYARIAQPQVAATALHVDIHARQRAVYIRGTYRLVNRSAAPIGSVHIATSFQAKTGAMKFNQPVARVVIDEELGHQTYELEKPLALGESLRLAFDIQVKPHGFRENGADNSVVKNGSYFTNGWLPAIGYQPGRELINASDRRQHGLISRPVIASLDDVQARNDRGGGGGTFEAVVSTGADQVAVAPGVLRRTWTKDARRFFEYSTDRPIGHEYAFFSARYAVHEARWEDPARDQGQNVAIRILHHPTHTGHLDGMARSIQASLDYYTREFGPYRQTQLSVIEGPGNGTGMHAESGVLTHAEGFSFWNPKAGASNLDLPYAIVAHEVAHQWTVPYANVEGGPVMSESIAWYYALKAVENARGPEQLRLLLSFMREPHIYPPIRRGQPLLRGLDPYLAYRKGPFALYTLSEYIGTNQVNAALRRLLEKHRQPGAPLATTLDLYSELQAVTPEPLRYLLHDLFQVNTSWQLAVEQARSEPTAPGWKVRLEVRARKVVHDVAGVEAEVPMNEEVEIGFYAAADKNFARAKPLYLQKHRIHSGAQTVIIELPHEPGHIGLDPRHLLIDLQRSDNTRKVTPNG